MVRWGDEVRADLRIKLPIGAGGDREEQVVGTGLREGEDSMGRLVLGEKGGSGRGRRGLTRREGGAFSPPRVGCWSIVPDAA